MTTLLTARASIALAGLVGVVGLAAPQTQSVFTTRGAFVALSVSDLDASTKWYYQVHGILKAGLIVDDFDKTLAALRSRGVAIAIGPFPATATQRANVIVKDNSGNLIQFFGPAVNRTR